MDKGTKFKICKVCGGGFEVTKEGHYVSRDATKTGFATAISDLEPKLYDTFDCPYCGCQNIMQERRRVYVEFEECILEENEDDWITAESECEYPDSDKEED